MWLLCLPQGIWVPSWTPTWICLLMYPKLCGSACYYLYNIRRIRKFLSREYTEQLVHAFVTSRLDHCNRPLYSVLDCQIMKLQRVMNANARLIYCARKFCHITPIRIELHRLPVRRRIKFKILLIDQKYCELFTFMIKAWNFARLQPTLRLTFLDMEPSQIQHWTRVLRRP